MSKGFTVTQVGDVSYADGMANALAAAMSSGFAFAPSVSYEGAPLKDAETIAANSFARATLSLIEQTISMVPASQHSALKALSSQLMAALASGDASAIREMSEKVRGEVEQAKAVASEDGPETPAKKIERLRAEIEQLEESLDEKMRKAHARGDISNESYEDYLKKRAREEALSDNDPNKAAATAAAAQAGQGALQAAADKAEKDGRGADADEARTGAGEATTILKKNEEVNIIKKKLNMSGKGVAQEDFELEITSAAPNSSTKNSFIVAEVNPEETAQLSAPNAPQNIPTSVSGVAI